MREKESLEIFPSWNAPLEIYSHPKIFPSANTPYSHIQTTHIHIYIYIWYIRVQLLYIKVSLICTEIPLYFSKILIFFSCFSPFQFTHNKIYDTPHTITYIHYHFSRNNFPPLCADNWMIVFSDTHSEQFVSFGNVFTRTRK